MVIWFGSCSFSPPNLVHLFGICLQLVSPGAWLTDMCQERYEVREKKSNKKVSDCWCFQSLNLLML